MTNHEYIYLWYLGFECTLHDCSFPLGGFYSDTLGFVAEGCKKCPNGSYVLYELTPGKSVLDCKACPQGEQQTKAT